MALRSKVVNATFSAVDAEDRDTLALLLDDDGTLLSSRDHRHDSLLHRAAETGNVELMDLLVNRGMGVDVNRELPDGTEIRHTPLHAAAMKNQIRAVDWLLQQGSDLEAGTKSSGTPLMAAALSGHVAMVRHFIQLGADVRASYEVDTLDGGKETMDARYLARLRGHSEVVALIDATLND